MHFLLLRLMQRSNSLSLYLIFLIHYEIVSLFLPHRHQPHGGGRWSKNTLDVIRNTSI